MFLPELIPVKANPSINHNVEPLLRKIMGYDASKGHNIPALNHGKEYEPIAKEKYISLMKQKQGIHILRKWAIC